jgi:putative NADH-flavin reductase
MKIAIVGAAGWIGSQITQEALSRGHEVTALVRDPNKITNSQVTTKKFDVRDESNILGEAVAGCDVVISSISGRHDGDQSIYAKAAQRYLKQLPETPVKKLLWVGGAGSLEVSAGVALVSTANFPQEYKAEAMGMGEALKVFQASNSKLNWLFISPAAEIFPGDKLGVYRITKDQLLVDLEGNSRISVADYAMALIDELESEAHLNQRIGVAY